MKVLVIGSGGREHALIWKLAQSTRIDAMWCAPGNAGIAGECLRNGKPVQCAQLGVEDFGALTAFAKEQGIDLTVVGPDNPLAAGIVDHFQGNGLRIWGPNKKAAQFEASKAFSQDFMQRHGIPTARSGTFENAATAREFVASLDGKCAVKADGLALGKGVLICQAIAEANAAIDELLVKGTFGAAGKRIVIQEFLEGTEVSLHALCDGKTARLFPSSQDHKRALDNDQGLNTGGMGTYSPAPFLTEAELQDVGRSILDPWLKGCASEGIDFRGILYPGVMLTDNGPKVLEFNARFGDPETQVYLVRLENDLLDLLEACVDQKLSEHELRWRPEAAVCVVMASGGYPGNYDKGVPIYGIAEAEKNQGVKVFHAGSATKDGQLVTAGGRVLGVTALGSDIKSARDAAYRAVEEIKFSGAHYRKDIAARALSFGTSARDDRASLLAGIAAHPFLRGLPEAHLEMLADCAMRSQFQAGEQIFAEGDPANRFYLITKGKVALESLRNGAPVQVQSIGAGDVLGWSWLFPPYVWHFSARAAEVTEAIFLYGTRVRALCDENHDLGYELMSRTANVAISRMMAARHELVGKKKASPR
jgi:phosphoribosylamine--glycine ligase